MYVYTYAHLCIRDFAHTHTRNKTGKIASFTFFRLVGSASWARTPWFLPRPHQGACSEPWAEFLETSLGVLFRVPSKALGLVQGLGV